MELLFSYGTLQDKKVQLETYGRVLKGSTDWLPGYRIAQMRITDADVLKKSKKEYHPIAVKSKDKKDSIKGCCFKITAAELAATDHYEVKEYQRIKEQTKAGKTVWVYTAKRAIK